MSLHPLDDRRMRLEDFLPHEPLRLGRPDDEEPDDEPDESEDETEEPTDD